jgi:alcohol dehydrogenase (NADP+)
MPKISAGDKTFEVATATNLREAVKINAYAAQNATTPLAPFNIQRRDVGKRDVQIEILYCGVCHSDLHTVRSEWQGTTYPCVPGHEIVGRVVKVGAQVSKFKEGDTVGVGCMVDSCLTCANCEKDLEQFCEKGTIWTYNAPDNHMDGMTFGGYSESIVVDKAFVIKLPKNLDLAAVAPLLCAGITTYSPLRHNNVRKGQKVGIVGLGGLGHMGVKIAKALGAHVVVFTTSPNKVDDALRLGADEVVNSKDAEAMKKHLNSFHFILDTVSAQHDINAYLLLLGRDGNLTQVGVPPEPLALNVGSLIYGRRSLSGSLIGGIKETQEMLDFCGKHNITADIELISIQNINEAYDRLAKGDVKYRFVIDIASLQQPLSATN